MRPPPLKTNPGQRPGFEQESERKLRMIGVKVTGAPAYVYAEASLPERAVPSYESNK